MPDKKFNKPTAWREKLGQFDGSGGLPVFDKGAAWEKLYARLEQPEKKKNLSWLWMTAAAILTAVFFTIAWLGTEKEEHTLPVVHLQQIRQPIKPSPTSAVKEKQESLTINDESKPGKVEKKRPQNTLEHSLKAAPVTQEPPELTPAIATAQIIQQPFVTIENKADSPLISLILEAQPRKKMAVVYLNEIDAVSNEMMTRQIQPKKRRPQLPKIGQSGDYGVYVTSKPERFTIPLSSAN